MGHTIATIAPVRHGRHIVQEEDVVVVDFEVEQYPNCIRHWGLATHTREGPSRRQPETERVPGDPVRTMPRASASPAAMALPLVADLPNTASPPLLYYLKAVTDAAHRPLAQLIPLPAKVY